MLSTVSGDNTVRRSDTVHPAESLAKIRFQTPGVNALGCKAIRQHRLQRRVGDATLQLVPGAAVTKPPPPVIFIPTRVSHICSGGGDFRKLQ